LGKGGTQELPGVTSEQKVAYSQQGRSSQKPVYSGVKVQIDPSISLVNAYEFLDNKIKLTTNKNIGNKP
jgi:hypothetical protein